MHLTPASWEQSAELMHALPLLALLLRCCVSAAPRTLSCGASLSTATTTVLFMAVDTTVPCRFCTARTTTGAREATPLARAAAGWTVLPQKAEVRRQLTDCIFASGEEGQRDRARNPFAGCGTIHT